MAGKTLLAVFMSLSATTAAWAQSGVRPGPIRILDSSPLMNSAPQSDGYRSPPTGYTTAQISHNIKEMLDSIADLKSRLLVAEQLIRDQHKVQAKLQSNYDNLHNEVVENKAMTKLTFINATANMLCNVNHVIWDLGHHDHKFAEGYTDIKIINGVQMPNYHNADHTDIANPATIKYYSAEHDCKE